MNALDPKGCTRCHGTVPPDSDDRPISLRSQVYAPINPRPTMPGGSHPDGTVVPPTEVWWEIEADYEKPGPIAALLCASCVTELQDWLYRHEPEAVAPAEGDRVRLTYGDGSSVEGVWRAVLEEDDGQLHTHTRGQVRRDVLTRAGAR